MENASQALRMGAAIIVFMLAISLFFHNFSSAKKSADSILKIQDKQAYLESDDIENTLYKSNSGVTSDTTNYSSEGNRIVGIDSVISTIYKYDKEKYGVTIFKEDGSLIARYDSSTEGLMNNWINITNTTDKDNYIKELKKNLTCTVEGTDVEPDLIDFTSLYKLTVTDDLTGTSNTVICAPWYGNHKNIMRRINADITGTSTKFNDKEYKGNNLFNNYKGKLFYEITKEIDNSKYYKDSSVETGLLKDYQMPTVEVIYIVKP